MSKLHNLQFTTGSTVNQTDETDKNVSFCLLRFHVYLILKHHMVGQLQFTYELVHIYFTPFHASREI